jgi:hypothetical protein
MEMDRLARRVQNEQRAWRSLLLIFALLSHGSALGAEEVPRRVLMLHAFNYSFPATSRIADAARKRLFERSSLKISIDADFLDLARISDPEHEPRTSAFLHEKYARTPPDVIMTLGSAALPFILKYRDAIAPKVPVVRFTLPLLTAHPA